MPPLAAKGVPGVLMVPPPVGVHVGDDGPTEWAGFGGPGKQGLLGDGTWCSLQDGRAINRMYDIHG